MAASSSIEVSISALATDVIALEQRLRSFCNHMRNAYELVRELDTMWDGEANREFVRQFSLDARACEEISTELEHLIGCMQFAQEEYIRCENQVGECIRAISV